jgi:hypothetical protein
MWFAYFAKSVRVFGDDGNRIRLANRTQAHHLPWHKKGDEPEALFWLGT